ncbi:MAG: hypothetical protein A2X99_04825 [Deltaproteobacteria bacterium GWB2_55_19]|nr:MAG: hypothetical protein A2X99_04825 [Deltaproteobacteria bacterium GWB2_55_19]HAO92376.1 hypothetical protein [Deltaproteobacteria bacterium]
MQTNALRRTLSRCLFVLIPLSVWGCGLSGEVVSDVTPPSLSVTVNNNESSTTTGIVTVDIVAEDDVSVAAYFISESAEAASANSAEWVSVDPAKGYTGTASFNLSSGYGNKTVYVWTMDASGNVSAPASAGIEYSFVESGEGRPNVIFIVVDTLRADHLSTYGYERDTSPYISAFAGSAVRFTQAISPAPWTLPAYTSILTGKHAFHHALNQPTLTGTPVGPLPKLLMDEGYKAVSIQTNYYLQNLDQAFKERYHYFDPEEICGSDPDCDWEHTGVQDPAAISRAIKWLNVPDNVDESFFMFIGLINPHLDYKTGNGYLEEFVNDSVFTSAPALSFSLSSSLTYLITYADLSSEVQSCVGAPESDVGYYQDSRLYIAAYDSEIKHTDYYIGLLVSTLKSLGLYDGSIIIITADHGENLDDFSPPFSHGNNLNNTLIHVPLLIKFPGQTEGLDVDSYVRTIDILPTVLDYAGLAPPDDVDGRSLIPVVNNTVTDAGDRPVLSYREDILSGDEGKYVSIIKDGFKLIKKGDGTYVLYNLELDPEEKYKITDPDRAKPLFDYLHLYYK